MNKKINTILFDLDGTLTDPMEGITKAVQYALKRFGVIEDDGYPEKYDKGFPITGFEKFKDDECYYCFHAGTKLDGDTIVTNGGRVLGITALGTDLKDARKNAYAATEWISFANKYKRNDIGKAIDEA